MKLGDFGLARVLNNESQFAFTHVGTPYYMSPEQIHDQKYNEKSDIWSLGYIIYELCALHPPFQALNPMALAMKIKEGKFECVGVMHEQNPTTYEVWTHQQHYVPQINEIPVDLKALVPDEHHADET